MVPCSGLLLLAALGERVPSQFAYEHTLWPLVGHTSILIQRLRRLQEAIHTKAAWRIISSPSIFIRSRVVPSLFSREVLGRMQLSRLAGASETLLARHRLS